MSVALSKKRSFKDRCLVIAVSLKESKNFIAASSVLVSLTGALTASSRLLFVAPAIAAAFNFIKKLQAILVFC